MMCTKNRHFQQSITLISFINENDLDTAAPEREKYAFEREKSY